MEEEREVLRKLWGDLSRAPQDGESDWNQKLQAARGAKRLAWDLPSSPDMGRGIIVEPLCKLMDHRSGSVAVEAASALSALADGDPSVQQALSSRNELKGLVRLMRSDVPGLPWRIASIIGRLVAQTDDMESKLEDAGGFDALLEQLHANDTRSQAKAAAVLGILAQGEMGRKRIIASHRSPRLVHMSRSLDSGVRLAAVRLLALLAIDDEETRQRAGSDEGGHNGIHLLVGNGLRGAEQDADGDGLVDGSVGVDIDGDGQVDEVVLSDYSDMKFHGIIAYGEGEIALRAAQLLARILDGGRSGVFNSDALEVVIAARGEEALVRMLRDGEVENAIAAAEVLSLMARQSPAAQKAIAAAGGTQALVELSLPTPEAAVDPDTDISQRFAALEALNSLATKFSDIRAQIVEEGGAQAAVVAAEARDLQLSGLELLASLAKDASSVDEIVYREGINCVAIVLRSILIHTDSESNELRAESPRLSVGDSKTSTSDDANLRPREILFAAVSAVASLAEHDQDGSIQGQMLHDGLAESLCAFLDLSLLEARARAKVLSALAAIAKGNARTQAGIARHGGLAQIVHAAVSTDEAVQNQAGLVLLAFYNAVRTSPPVIRAQH